MENIKETSFVVLGILVLLSIGTYKYFAQDDESQPINLPTKSITHNYYLVVGSFLNEEFAQSMSDSLKSIGYKSELLHSNEGMTRVSIFKTKDEKEAKEMKNIYKQDIEKIWTYYE
jgi:hypothetical protein